LCLNTDVSEFEKFVFICASTDFYANRNKAEIEGQQLHVCFHMWIQVHKVTLEQKRDEQ
jgi:hypothetical protein